MNICDAACRHSIGLQQHGNAIRTYANSNMEPGSKKTFELNTAVKSSLNEQKREAGIARDFDDVPIIERHGV